MQKGILLIETSAISVKFAGKGKIIELFGTRKNPGLGKRDRDRDSDSGNGTGTGTKTKL